MTVKSWHFALDELKQWIQIATDLLDNGCKFLGISETTNRHDGLPILVPNYHDHVVFRYGIETAVQEGYLSEVYGLAVQTQIEPDECSWDKSDLKLTFSDAKFADKAKAIRETLEYVSKQRKRMCQTIMFVKRVVDAHRFKATLENNPVLGNIEVVEAKTSGHARQQIFNDFRSGKINILINVGVLTEGVNLPNCDTVAMCRNTRSRNLYEQMLGRGTRICANKDYLLVIDFVDNISQHHFEDIVTSGTFVEKERNELVSGPIFTQRLGSANKNARIVEVFYSELDLYRRFNFLPFEEDRDLVRRMPVMRDSDTMEIDWPATRELHEELNYVW